MSSQAFDGQLLGPDNHESHMQLADLIATGRFTGTGLPEVAHRYLDAFCNKSCSNDRRRLAGIALAGMMRASTSVVQRLKKLSQGLSRLGDVILNPKESEERKVVAGLIVRQGLEAGIDFAHFWVSDKIFHSAPNFPRDATEGWMGQFQMYLDTLNNLALGNMNSDAMILYPISLSVNDGFQWAGKSAVAVIEQDLLTILVSDSTLTSIRVIDIPVSHIKDKTLQQESPHESQEGRSGLKMHTLVMALQTRPSTYRLDSSDREGSVFKVSFLTQEDADEFDVGIQDARKSSDHPMTATGQAIASAASNHSSDSASEQRTNTTPPQNYRADAPSHSNSDVRGTVGKHLPLERMTEGQNPGSEKSNGKLPRITNAVKQKVIQLPQSQSGNSRVTKSRSKKASIVLYANEDDEDEEATQDVFDLKTKGATQTSVGAGTGKKAQGRRKSHFEDDDDFVPASRAKPKVVKRKRGSSDASEERQPKKKTQTKPESATARTTKKQNIEAQGNLQMSSVRARKPMINSTAHQNLPNIASSRHTLIGAMMKTNSPSKAPAATFKRPGQPASTPGRPRAPPIETTPKSRTPVEAPQTREDHPTHLPSYTPSRTPRRTPRSQAMHDEDFGIDGTPANSEILSSNTKRLPDSPHAESTAISGHANCDDIQREKTIGDMETARKNPFNQKGKENAFTRKLTDGSVHEEPLSIPADLTHDDEADELVFNLSQPLPKHSPSLFKHRTQSRPRQNSSTVQMKVRKASVNVQEDYAAVRVTARSLVFEDAHDSSKLVPKGAHSRKTKLSPARARKDRVAESGSIVSAPRETIEDTLPDMLAGVEDQGGEGEETTLVGEEIDMPNQYSAKASELHFRSSPPIADSSSIQGASSDESEAEPEMSPPTSRADELEWEAALEPHQRALHDQLLRTSKRVVRHIVDNETAVTDITDVFADDGERMLNLLLERQGDETAEAFQGLASKRKALLEELEGASKNLKVQRRQARAME